MDPVETYFAKIEAPVREIAAALRLAVEAAAPSARVALAWGFPCWSGTERFLSIIAHKAHCNLQLLNGVQLAARWPDRIAGTGKQLRHVKVRSASEIDDELRAIIAAAVALDAADGNKQR